MERITKKQLERLVNWINRATNSPETAFTVDETGKYTANIGAFYLSGAYGGVNLVRICTDGGGVENVFNHGHVPKRQLWQEMRAFLAGLEAAKREQDI